MTRFRPRWLSALLVGPLFAACASATPDAPSTVYEDALTGCSFSVTHNSYDSGQYWGAITVKNAGSTAWSGFKVDFYVPSGAHCTNDAVPSGATLSPLTGSGSSAYTTSNHCIFTWGSASLAPGASKAFNYSTDSSTAFSAATSVSAGSGSCGTSGTGGTGGGSSAGGSSAGGSSAGGSSGSSSGGSAGTTGTGCATPGLTWKSANKTNFTSYPDPGSEECIKYSGCLYEGEFAACNKTESKAWVQAHNIVSVFPNLKQLALHDLCLKSGSKTIVVTVLDECADSDCSGCCTQNKGSADELIDIESFTDARFGVADGPIQWADLGPTKTAGCN